MGDEVLLGAPTQPPGTQAYEGLDPTRAETPKARGGSIVIEVAEKLSSRTRVLRNSGLGKPTDVEQIRCVRRQQPLARRQ